MDATYTGEQIANRRKALGMTQKELAEKLHVTDKAVSKWERGVNFPDLGLLEDLADALETKPTVLLGLEESQSEEIVSSLVELSAEQAESAQRDVRLTGWGCMALAALLALVNWYLPRHTPHAYQLLYWIIFAAELWGWYFLVHYGEIKPFDPGDLFVCLGGGIPIFAYLFIQLVTGRSPHPLFAFLLVCAAAVCFQWLCCRVIRPWLAKALPLMGTALYLLWQLWSGGCSPAEAAPAVCCAAVFGLFVLVRRKQLALPPKKVTTILCILLVLILVLVFACYPILVRGYVLGNQQKLTQFAEDALALGDAGSYGLWSVWVDEDSGTVIFHTGGSGLAPGSTYEGFYYSPDDSHSAYYYPEAPLDIQGDTAYWRAPDPDSDNWGKSTKICDHWYWFEAHF